MSEEETITITAERHEELLDAEEKLTALENFGVDNWDWYGDAMQSIESEEDNE